MMYEPKTSSILTSFGNSNPQKRKQVENFVFSNMQKGEWDDFLQTFQGDSSFYLTTLPSTCRREERVAEKVQEEVVDWKMRGELAKASVSGWSFRFSCLPLKVPQDDNSLLHSVSLAVWGIHDDTHLLRDCTYMSVGPYDSERVEDDLMPRQKRSSKGMYDMGPAPASFARAMDRMTVYTVANILRRPIIVITSPPPDDSCFGDGGLGGVYLPLEWWGRRRTCRTPVILGCSGEHFSPLVFEEPRKSGVCSPCCNSNENFFPLVNSMQHPLPVRLLLKSEKAEEKQLLKRFLKTKIVSYDGTKILCARVRHKRMPDRYNLMKDYVQLCRTLCKKEKNTIAAKELPETTGV